MQTSVKELKDHLSNYLHRVQRGEELVITSHNRPVAKLIPITEPEIYTKKSRASLFDDIEKLHHRLGKVSLKKSMRETILEMRKEERY